MTIQEKTSQEKNNETIIFTQTASRKKVVKEGGNIIKLPEDVVPFLRFIKDKKQEHFVIVTLSACQKIIAIRTITIGLVNVCQVHPREVFADAITDRAVSIIAAHNHPSGDLTVSREDKQITDRLKESAKLLGIHFLDHLIISKTGFRSIETGYEDIEFFRRKKTENPQHVISTEQLENITARLNRKYERSQKCYEYSKSMYEPSEAVAGEIYQETISILQQKAGAKKALTEAELSEVKTKLKDMYEHYSSEANALYNSEDQFLLLESNYISAKADICEEVIELLENYN
ncbi:JAB domain-containing protein [Leptolyngbya sp. GB1-A1]|uniref:JAB domain-containing protein n=1 Tax=Leptolyngbya sp. GB1-A1 TaxID=2933908 RepID=UPI00329842E8